MINWKQRYSKMLPLPGDKDIKRHLLVNHILHGIPLDLGSDETLEELHKDHYITHDRWGSDDEHEHLDWEE